MHRFLHRATALAALAALAVVPVRASANETFTWSGKSGFVKQFTLKGGHYQVYINAHYVPSLVTHSGRSCTFGGTFSELAPKQESSTLGPGGFISTGIHYSVGPKPVDLEAGTYRLFITAATTCTWRFTLVS